MADSSKDVAHIKKFDGTDFPFWKYQVELVLEQHHLLQVTKGTEVCPQPDIQEGGVVGNQEAIALWKAKDVAARACLISTIEDSCKRSLLNCRTAAEVWGRLAVQFQQNAAESKHILCNQLYQYTFESDNSVVGHVSAIEGMVIQLRDPGVEVSTTQLMSKILLTLPPSFRSFQSAWDLLPDANKTIATLTLKLVLAEMMNKHFGASSEEGERKLAYTGQNCRKKKGDEKGFLLDKINGECPYCGWNNHCVQDCFLKVRHEREIEASRSRAKKSKRQKGSAPKRQREQEEESDDHNPNDGTSAIIARSFSRPIFQQKTNPQPSLLNFFEQNGLKG